MLLENLTQKKETVIF